MSDVKEVLNLLKLDASLQKEYKEELKKISEGDFPESLQIELEEKTKLLLNKLKESDAELQEFYNQNDTKNFEKIFDEKYEKEFDKLVDQMMEEYFKPFYKKDEEIEQQLKNYPLKSLLLASSLYYGRRGAKKTGEFSAKIGKNTGKFVGNKIKDGGIYLWDNKEEFRDKIVDAAMKNQEQVEKKSSRLEKKYKRYSNDKLLEVIRDENTDRIDRGMANKILKERQ